MKSLTIQEQQVIESLPWGMIVPLALELFREVRENGFLSDRSVELIMELVQLVIASQQVQAQAGNWQVLIGLLIKFLPIIIELIGKSQAEQVASLLSRELEAAPRS